MAAAAPPSARTESLQLVNCGKDAGEFVATLRDRLVLERAFLDESVSEDENIHQAVLQQLKYLWGHYRTNAEAHRSMQVVLSAEEPVIRVEKKIAGPYGRDLTLDWKETSKRLEISDPYTVRAIKRGYTRSDDPALVVDYEVDFKLAICGRAETPKDMLEVPLPKDPWLFYWHVPAAARHLMTYYGSSSITNPCSDDDFADLPLPFYYWYDWEPDRHGDDAEGKPFDCRTLLHKEVDFFSHQVKLRRLPSASGDFSHLRGALLGATEGAVANAPDHVTEPLSATVLFGVFDHTVTDPGFTRLVAELGDGDTNLPARARAALKARVEREPGTVMLLETLRDLPGDLAISEHHSAVEDGLLRVEVRGTLKRSGRPLRLRAYLGLTDIFGPTPPNHWPVLRKGLAEDHLVIYWGHSGLGENFRLSRIEDRTGITHAAFMEELKRSPVRLVAFISCYSYMYFGQDLLAAGAENQGEKTFVFTGVGGIEHDPGVLPLFDLLDQVLDRKNTGAKVKKMRGLDDENFWIVKEVSGKRPDPN